MTDLKDIAGRFLLEGEILSIERVGEGFINDTFRIFTSADAPDYILQRKNSNVFRDVEGMMSNIMRVTAHIRKKVSDAGGDSSREVLTVVPAEDGRPFFRDPDGNYWTVSVFVKDAVVYDKADSLELARMGGEGIGRFQEQLSDFAEPLTDTIPGFHDIRHRFSQWDDTLRRDPAGRRSALAEEISWIESRRERMLGFKKLVEEGTIPTRVTHNDTKISNILFDGDGKVLCVIDLDTVMSAPALYDFGDAIRSYANTGEEDDRNLENVGISLDMFRAYAEGYLSARGGSLTEAEKDNLAFSALYITYEQVLRFLMDYIDGDNYYKIKYPDHNLVRTHAQFKLLTDMEGKYGDMVEIVAGLCKR